MTVIELEKMKVAIYTRVSTEEQTTLNQLLRLQEQCKQRGWEYVIFEETQSSRKTRPVKNGLLQRLRNKEFDAVLVYKLDRWARSSSELILEVTELVTKGIGFVSYSENLDFSTATGKLMFNLLSTNQYPDDSIYFINIYNQFSNSILNEVDVNAGVSFT